MTGATLDTTAIWVMIVSLAVGSFLLRFAFIGLVGDRDLPPWLLRHLRYTAVAILPALITPLVVWPGATGGSFDPARGSAALVTFVVGYFSKNVILAIAAGAGTLFGLLYLLG